MTPRTLPSTIVSLTCSDPCLRMADWREAGEGRSPTHRGPPGVTGVPTLDTTPPSATTPSSPSPREPLEQRRIKRDHSNVHLCCYDVITSNTPRHITRPALPPHRTFFFLSRCNKCNTLQQLVPRRTCSHPPVTTAEREVTDSQVSCITSNCINAPLVAARDSWRF